MESLSESQKLQQEQDNKLQKQDSFEDGGLSLNLKKTNTDSEDDNEDNQIEDDLDLLEYQRSRSTPKVVISELEQDDEANPSDFNKEASM